MTAADHRSGSRVWRDGEGSVRPAMPHPLADLAGAASEGLTAASHASHGQRRRKDSRTAPFGRAGTIDRMSTRRREPCNRNIRLITRTP
jgi:hypothetical protein